MKQTARLALLALCAQLAACSVLEGDKIDYKSATTGPSLAVPPDLTQLSRDTRYALPAAAVSANQQAVAAPQGIPTAATALGDVRIERAGAQRWLVVNKPADQLWGPVRDFWQENGFLLTLDEANLGIMETDWAENRAKIPQDGLRNLLGRVFDNLYSTSERDRFRTRLERNANGSTEIYISHRGVIEVYSQQASNNQVGQTVWQARPSDPELEAEFLRRLMVKLGVPQEQAKAVTASPAPKANARATQVGNVPVVQLDDGFDRAWRRVGLALDRTGFTVEDRDRAQGTYFVRYVDPVSSEQGGGGFFSRMFSSAKPATPVKYRIAVRSQGESTTVSVLNATGTPESSATAQRIVQLLADDLK